MYYSKEVQKVVNYINQNIYTELPIDDVIAKSSFSRTHFYRIFYRDTGFKIKEYIRNKRFASAAAQMLFEPNKTIERISYEVGFNSKEVFIRAFKRLYGVTPLEYKKHRTDVLICEKNKAVCKHFIKQEEEQIHLTYECKEEEEMHLVGVNLIFPLVKSSVENEGVLPLNEFCNTQLLPHIKEIKGIKKFCETTLVFSFDITNNLCEVFAGVEVNLTADISSMETKVLKKSNYVHCRPSKVLLNPLDNMVLINHIFNEYIPISGCELSGDFFISRYRSDGYFPQIESLYSKQEIWIPIK